MISTTRAVFAILEQARTITITDVGTTTRAVCLVKRRVRTRSDAACHVTRLAIGRTGRVATNAVDAESTHASDIRSAGIAECATTAAGSVA